MLEMLTLNRNPHLTSSFHGLMKSLQDSKSVPMQQRFVLYGPAESLQKELLIHAYTNAPKINSPTCCDRKRVHST